MADIKQLDSVPVLDQNLFPALPEIPEELVAIPFDSPWKHAETEYAAGILLTKCARAGAWKAVSAPDFLEAVGKHPMLFGPMMRDVAGEVWTFVSNGEAEMISVNEMQYIVPTPQFARNALANPAKMRYA